MHTPQADLCWSTLHGARKPTHMEWYASSGSLSKQYSVLSSWSSRSTLRMHSQVTVLFSPQTVAAA